MSIDMLTSSHDHETEPLEVDRVAFIDLDRTIFKTELFFADVCTELTKMGLDDNEVSRFTSHIKSQKGNDPDWIAQLSSLFPETLSDIETVVSKLFGALKADSQKYFHDGVIERLHIIDQMHDMLAVIYTKGGDHTQSLKLGVLFDALGFELPFVITQTDNKSAEIEQTIQTSPDGKIYLPASILGIEQDAVARRVVVLDDKQRNLDHALDSTSVVLVDNERVPSNGGIPVCEALDRLIAA